MKTLSLPTKTLLLGFGTPFEANEANNLIQNPSVWETNLNLNQNTSFCNKKKKKSKPASQLDCNKLLRKVIMLADSTEWNVQNQVKLLANTELAHATLSWIQGEHCKLNSKCLGKRSKRREWEGNPLILWVKYKRWLLRARKQLPY